MPMSVSPEHSDAISEQAALYIQTLRQKREEIKLQREIIRGSFNSPLQPRAAVPPAASPSLGPFASTPAKAQPTLTMENFMKNEYANINSANDQEEKIKRLEESLERERAMGQAMRMELIETQNQKHLLETKIKDTTRGHHNSKLSFNREMRMAEAKLNGMETIENEVRALKVKLENQQHVVDTLNQQLRDKATANGRIMGKVKVNEVQNAQVLKALEEENKELMQALKRSKKDAKSSQKENAKLKRKLSESKDVIISLRHAVNEIHAIPHVEQTSLEGSNSMPGSPVMDETKSDAGSGSGGKSNVGDAENAKVKELEERNKTMSETIEELEREQLSLLEAAEKDAHTIQQLYSMVRIATD